MEKEIKELGLDNYESRAFAILLIERLNIRQISKKANIPFGKVYSVIKSLKKKNLVSETDSRPKLVYVDNPSEKIQGLLNRKNESDKILHEKIIQKIANLENKKDNQSSFFEIGTTNDKNRDLQLRTFNEAKDEILQIINVHHKPKSNREIKTEWEKSIVKATERGVVLKSIYPNDIELPAILNSLNKKHPEKFQIRRFNTDFTRCDIIDSNKVMIKLIHQDPLQFGGILFIEN
jgi:sugar-specific transcriptional regulator TrmB